MPTDKVILAANIVDELTKYRLCRNFETDFENLLLRANNRGESISLVFIDIDNFQNANKLYGKAAGDLVLVTVAEQLKNIFPGDYIFCRYGGDCFALLLYGIEKETAFLYVEKAREALTHEWVTLDSGQQFNFTISAGVATYKEDGATVAELIRKADGALYRAKKTGKNKVAIAREEKMITKTSHYTAEQLQRLSGLAKEVGMGEASLLREALSDVIKKYDDKKCYSNGKTVILVDDSSFMRASLREFMIKNGYKVLGDFENGRSAASYYNDVPVDFVLLDILMPVMDGIEFLKNIKKREGCRIIAISAISKPEVVLSAVENGADYFIVKPFQTENLLNILSWESGAFLKPSRLENYRSYYKGKRFADNFMLSQAEIDAVRML